MRIVVTMACEKCKERNYTTTKNKNKTTERLSKKKFCSRCNSHTLHKETK